MPVALRTRRCGRGESGESSGRYVLIARTSGALVNFVAGLLLGAFEVGLAAQAAPLLVHFSGALPALRGGAALAAPVGAAALRELLIEVLALELALLAQHAAAVEPFLVVRHVTPPLTNVCGQVERHKRRASGRAPRRRVRSRGGQRLCPTGRSPKSCACPQGISARRSCACW